MYLSGEVFEDLNRAISYAAQESPVLTPFLIKEDWLDILSAYASMLKDLESAELYVATYIDELEYDMEAMIVECCFDLNICLCCGDIIINSPQMSLLENRVKFRTDARLLDISYITVIGGELE